MNMLVHPAVFGLLAANPCMVRQHQRRLTIHTSMQVSWEVMAGHLPTLVAASAGVAAPEMGVFVGIQQMEYGSLAAPHLSSLGPYSASGSPFSVAAGRLSFTYNLKGAIDLLSSKLSRSLAFLRWIQAFALGALNTPNCRHSSRITSGRTCCWWVGIGDESKGHPLLRWRLSLCSAGPAVSIDTACSSALVATHLGRSHLATAQQAPASALAAGVNLMLSETTTAAAFAAGMLTSDGRCKTLDAAADGYVRSEACIAVLLTTQGDVAAGSRGGAPLPGGGALLRATYVNQDGRSSSLTAPNGPSQQQASFSASPCAVAKLHMPTLHSWHASPLALDIGCTH